MRPLSSDGGLMTAAVPDSVDSLEATAGFLEASH